MRKIIIIIAVIVFAVVSGLYFYFNPPPPKKNCAEWVKITSVSKIEYKCLREEYVK